MEKTQGRTTYLRQYSPEAVSGFPEAIPWGGGCCRCPPLPHTQRLLPFLQGPPRTAPCLSAGRGDGEKESRSPLGRAARPLILPFQVRSEEPGSRRVLKDGKGQDHIDWS